MSRLWTGIINACFLAEPGGGEENPGQTERQTPVGESTTRKVFLDAVLSAIDDEEELDGEMSDGLYDALRHGDRRTIAKALRIAVKLTKSSIRRKVLDAFETENGAM